MAKQYSDADVLSMPLDGSSSDMELQSLKMHTCGHLDSLDMKKMLLVTGRKQKSHMRSMERPCVRPAVVRADRSKHRQSFTDTNRDSQRFFCAENNETKTMETLSSTLASRLRVIGVVGITVAAVTGSAYLFYRLRGGYRDQDEGLREDQREDQQEDQRRVRRIVVAERRCEGLQMLVFGPREVRRADLSTGSTYSNWFRRGAKEVQVNKQRSTVVKGRHAQRWWTVTHHFYQLSAEGPPQLLATVRAVTSIKYTCGQLTELTAYQETEATCTTLQDGFLKSQTCRTFQGVALSPAGQWFSTERSVSSADRTPTAPPTRPKDDVPAEGREVPHIYNHLRFRLAGDFTTRMLGLRQAFTILMSHHQMVNFLTVAGELVFGGMAIRSQRDPLLFKQAYHRLVAHAQAAAHLTATRIELARSGIFHYDFLDVVYELCVFGIFEGTMPSDQVPGGFLDHLTEMIQTIIPLGDCEPVPELYLQTLRDELLGFLETIFSFPEQLYSTPQPLASAVWDCLGQHMHQCLETLSNI